MCRIEKVEIICYPEDIKIHDGTGFPNKDARLLVGTVFTTWTIFSEL